MSQRTVGFIFTDAGQLSWSADDDYALLGFASYASSGNGFVLISTDPTGTRPAGINVQDLFCGLAASQIQMNHLIARNETIWISTDGANFINLFLQRQG